MTAGNGQDDWGHGAFRMRVREILAECGEKLHALGGSIEHAGHYKLAKIVRGIADQLFAARNDIRGPRDDL